MTASQQAPKDPLQGSIQYIKGVGPRLASRFQSRGIQSVGEALFFLPRRYEDRRQVLTISQLQPGEQACFTAQLIDFGGRRTGPRRSMFEAVLGDDTGRIVARWFRFNQAAFAKRFQRGDTVRVAGKVEVYRGVRQLVHPDLEKDEPASQDPAADFETIIPVYPEIEGVHPKSLRKIMRRVVEGFSRHVVELLPEELTSRHNLPSLAAALQLVHFPNPSVDIDQLNLGRSAAHRRVIYEEFLLLQLGLAVRRSWYKNQSAHPASAPTKLLQLARRLFGFDLTVGQQRVLTELLADLSSDKPMNRLLQGDVGSGKTVLAVLLGLTVVRSGAQVAIMAPTEVLAEQHHRHIAAVLSRLEQEVRVVYLSSAVKGLQRRQALEQIKSGQAGFVIGTQALIESGVEFSRLGLCVIDEQHRFGVMQRARLRSKGHVPHVLVMTATPIPRTLAMTVYGDLDVSILDELPPGRSPIRTVVLGGKQVRDAYQHVIREVAAGGQAFLVYPLVAESDKLSLLDATQMFDKFQHGIFSGLRLGLLHGRMPTEEKLNIMKAFSSGQLDVLVSTTVVEVGLDVPNASLMVIEHAERFGLSQLHQLRGRVGRGDRPATCYLIGHNLASVDARSRLHVMEKTNDGFLIAEEDLAIRGPGEFLGTRQSGLPSFVVGDLLRDADLLALARQDAMAICESDPRLESSRHQALREALWKRWGQRLALAEVG